MEDVIELNSKDNITKAEVVIKLINTLTCAFKEKALRLDAYIDIEETRVALQLAELNKLYQYREEIRRNYGKEI